MRVLSVIHYPIYGGPHHRNAAVIPALRTRGIETTVVIPDESGNAYEHLQAQGVTTIRMPLSRMRGGRDPVTHLKIAGRFRSDVSRLRGLLRATETDLVLVNGLVNPHAAIAGHLEDIPVVWQLLDTATPIAVRRLMMPMVTALADAIMSSGRPAAEEHPGATAFGERLVPFFSVVDTKRFSNSTTARQAARTRLGLPADCAVVGNVNNINLIKGHDLFVQAAGELHRRRPNTRFVILGAQSPHHAEYVSGLWRAAERLGLRLGRELIVFDPGVDVALFAPAFDVFWLTSPPRSEGVSTVIGEAMSLELPVVATRVGSVPESVADGVTGTLVPPLDPRALVEATLPYLDDRDLRVRVGAAGRARAKELYAREVCAERHERAFRLAIEHRQSRKAKRKHQDWM
jgi:glycosyltransferase involved in cell wall biosynthesis